MFAKFFFIIYHAAFIADCFKPNAFFAGDSVSHSAITKCALYQTALDVLKSQYPDLYTGENP